MPRPSRVRHDVKKTGVPCCSPKTYKIWDKPKYRSKSADPFDPFRTICLVDAYKVYSDTFTAVNK